MLVEGVKRTGRKWLVNILGSNRLTRNLARRVSLRLSGMKDAKWVRSRISGLSAHDYFAPWGEPDLNVILVVVDSLRNANLSCRGYFRQTTPFLDSLQSRFTAISAAPWTYPSVASILTGLYPHNHNAVAGGGTKDVRSFESLTAMRADVLTLPEMFMLLGYRTYFGTTIEMAYLPVRGRVVAERRPRTRAEEMLRHMTAWISKDRRTKFFAYVHLGDLHVGVMNPAGAFRDFFGRVTLPAPKGDIDNYILCYDNALRYVDSAIEGLFGWLRERRLLEHTVVVVTGDHGEEFTEHEQQEREHFYDQRGFAGFGHGHNVFGVNIEVPLLLSGPVSASGFDGVASTVDILPTLLGLIKVKPRIHFDGVDLFSGQSGERYLLSESTGYGYEKKALIAGRYKLIYSREDGVQWVFDLERDPQERSPVVDRELTSMFVNKLNRLMAEDERRRVARTLRKKSLSAAARNGAGSG